MGGHKKGYHVVSLAVFLEFFRTVALMAIKEQEAIATHSPGIVRGTPQGQDDPRTTSITSVDHCKVRKGWSRGTLSQLMDGSLVRLQLVGHPYNLGGYRSHLLAKRGRHGNSLSRKLTE